MHKHIFLRRVASSLLAALAVGAAVAHVPAYALDKVSVRLNWIPGSEHAYFFLGKEKGWYAAEGIDLEILPGKGSTVSVTTVGSGDTDFALADGASVARGWEVGVPVVVTSVLLKDSPASIYSRKSSGIATIADLCGKRVGVNLKSTTTAQYKAMVALAAPKDCKIEEVPTTAGGSKELLAGLVDAAVTFSYEDPVQLKVKGVELNEIIAGKFFKLYSLGLITNRNLLTNKRDVVNRFMRVTMRSMQYAIAHPDEALAAFLKTSPEANIDYEREKLALFNRLLLADDSTGKSLGKHDLKGWQASLETMQKLGIVKARIDPAEKFVSF
ncbi:MAG TPA: ABC transporter substrate-binding protein [Burkholderiaceae bacterium]|jgi:NitT/TauT family transport system substrate-binding protein|nr:ABC transporter substrate-binding protein [Burkholderiaceae bacterium]